jgi:hypothetical protein
LPPDVDTAPSPADSAAAASVLSGAAPAVPQPAAADRAVTVNADTPSGFDTTNTPPPPLAAPAAAPAGARPIDAVRESLAPKPGRAGGHWARAIISGALAGLAAGAQAEATEPRSERIGAPALSGLAAGFQGEKAERERTEDRAQAQQAQAAEEQRKAQSALTEDQLRKAQTAYYTTQNASLGFELTRNQAKATEDAVNVFNTFEKAVGADPANTDLGIFPNMQAVLAYRKEHPELAAQLAGGHDAGQIVAAPNLVQGEDGQWTYQGLRAAIVHPSVLDRPVSDVFGDQPVPGIPYFVPGKMTAQGQEPGTWNTAAPAPSTRYGDYLGLLQKGSADAARESNEQFKAGIERQRLLDEEKTKPAAPETPQGKKFAEEAATSAAKDVETARGGDFRFRSMSGSYPLALKGDQQAMMNILTNHIGMTLGMQKGARITKDILREAQQSQPWLAGVKARFDKDGLLNGVVLTKEQMQQMMTLSTAQRANAWAQAVESARQAGVADQLQIPADVRIRVKSPDGKFGTVPGGQLSQAEESGYEVAPQ